MKKTEILANKFRSVEFMRQVREELSDQFRKDKQKYLEYIKESMDDFKRKQNEHLRPE